MRADEHGGNDRAGEGDQRRDLERGGEPVDERLGRRGARRPRAATIAPITAIPTEPPTWRNGVEHRRADAGLVDGHRPLIAAAALGVIVSAIPTPPMSIAGSRTQVRRLDAEREK